MLMEMKTSVDTLTNVQKAKDQMRTMSPDSTIGPGSPKTPYLPAPGPGMQSLTPTPDSEEQKSPNSKSLAVNKQHTFGDSGKSKEASGASKAGN